ncbi:hypothetical protein HGI81_00260 [Olsenella sp. KGMB02461]|nr:hypothetical protein [Olsenella sp. KGMB02461]
MTQYTQKATELLAARPYSKSGLIAALKPQDTEVALATAAVDSLKIDWNSQATAMAAALHKGEYVGHKGDTHAAIEVYLISQGFDRAEAERASVGVLGQKGAWMKSGNRWWYRHDNGTYTSGGWEKIQGTWYLFDGAGWMRTGWARLGDIWYYLYPSGAMATGWVWDGSHWYYLTESGAMATGWLKLGDTWYYLTGSGAMATGWVWVGSHWYYLYPSGAMATGWVWDGSHWYYLTESGAMATGWLKLGDTWYYLTGSGAMATGWVWVGSHWYYLYPSGAMATGWQRVGGVWYLLEDSGAMRAGQWVHEEGRWYYLKPSGAMDNYANSELHDTMESIIVTKLGGHTDGALKRAYDYVASFPYQKGSTNPTGDWSGPFALEMYRNGRGNCYRYASLFCWLARGLGYSIDVHAGSVMLSRGPAVHGWTELYLNGQTYVVDPDMQHAYPNRNFYMTTYATAPIYYLR